MANYATAAAGNQISNQQIDANHPYFLHNSNHPGMVLVTQLLTDTNYNQWKRSVMITLSPKYKLGMVDGTLPRPVAISLLLNYWIRCNDMVIS